MTKTTFKITKRNGKHYLWLASDFQYRIFGYERMIDFLRSKNKKFNNLVFSPNTWLIDKETIKLTVLDYIQSLEKCGF